MATAEDVGLAGRGDLEALRRLRDHWLAIVTRECANPLPCKDDVMPQLELLAELAYAAGEAEDQVALIVVYQVRAEKLAGDVAAFEDLARQAVEANDAAALDMWTRSVVEFGERLGFYRAKLGALQVSVLNDGEAEGAAMLVAALTIRADSGDDRAVGMLQRVMDSVTPLRAQAITAEVIRMEGATVQ